MEDLQIVPVGKNVEPQYVEMKVPLYSYGCERKVKKALSKLRGIYSINADYTQQKVTVWGICNKDYVLANIKNKRKDARFWNDEDKIKFEEIEKQQQRQLLQREATNFTSSNYRTSKAVLAKAKSFSFRAFKKVFDRSHSF